MTQEIIIAILALVGVSITALLGYLAAQQSKVAARQASLETRIRALEVRDRQSWFYIRSLIDYAYRHSDTTKFPLPPPPEGWLANPE